MRDRSATLVNLAQEGRYGLVVSSLRVNGMPPAEAGADWNGLDDDDDDDDDDDESRVVTQSELNAVTKQYEALLGRVEKLEEAAGVRQLPVSDDGHDILGAAEQGMQLTTTSKDLVR